MPLHEYQCENCGSTAETLGRVPECCGKPMKRKMSVCNHTFGWRLTEESHLPGREDKLEKAI